MTFFEILLSALLVLPRFSLDTESPAERIARMGQIAQVIDDATLRATCAGSYASAECRPVWLGSRRQLGAALIALGWHESKFAQAIGEGHCETLPVGMRCDRGRARGYFQLWKVACPVAWQEEHGSAAELRESSWCAARLLSSAYRFCSADIPADPWARAFGRYAGRTCAWAGGIGRVRTMRQVLSSFDRARPVQVVALD